MKIDKRALASLSLLAIAATMAGAAIFTAQVSSQSNTQHSPNVPEGPQLRTFQLAFDKDKPPLCIYFCHRWF